MDNQYWHQKWQSKEIGFNQLQPNLLLQDYFSSLKLKAGSCVFVPLCGKSIDMLWLSEQGYQVIGVELSQLACDSFFKENKIAVTVTEILDFVIYRSQAITIFCGDFFKINRTILHPIDAIYDRAALIALPKTVRKLYAKHLIELATPATAMLLLTLVYNQNEMRGPPFSVDEDEILALYSAHFDVHQLSSKPCEVAAHLRAKGLTQAIEEAYFLAKITSIMWVS